VEHAVRLHIAPGIGQMQVGRVRPSNVQAWVKDRSTPGRASRPYSWRSGTPLRPSRSTSTSTSGRMHWTGLAPWSTRSLGHAKRRPLRRGADRDRRLDVVPGFYPAAKVVRERPGQGLTDG
jgi:hypothetical protein